MTNRKLCREGLTSFNPRTGEIADRKVGRGWLYIVKNFYPIYDSRGQYIGWMWDGEYMMPGAW